MKAPIYTIILLLLTLIGCAGSGARSRARAALDSAVSRYYATDSLPLAGIIGPATSLSGRGDTLDMQAQYYLGLAYYGEERYTDALMSLLEAERLARRHSQYLYLGRALRAQADVYHAMMDLPQWYRSSSAALDAFERGGLAVHAHWERISKADVLTLLGRSVRAEQVIDSIPQAALRSDTLLRAAYYRRLVWIKHDLGQCRAAMDTSLQLMHLNVKHRSADYTALGMYAVGCDDFEIARCALERASAIATDADDSAKVSYLRYRLSAASGDIDAAYAALRKCYESDTRYYESKLTAPFNLLVRQNFDEKVRSAESAAHRILVASSAAIALIIAIVVAYILYTRRRNRINEQKHLEMLADISHIAKRLRIDNYRHLDVLCRKWYGITAGTINEKVFVKEVIEALTSLKGDRIIHELEDWLNAYHDDIMRHFRSENPDITAATLKVVIYSFIGLSSETIAILLDKKVNSIYTAKSRLKSRLNDTATPHRDLFLKALLSGVGY